MRVERDGRRLVLGAVVALALAEVQGVRAQDARAIEARALQYWAKRQAKDLANSWTFYCSEYRTRVTQPQFMQMTRLIRFDLRDITVAQVQLNGSKAEVTISYHFTLPTVPDQQLDGRSTDTWSKDADGQWCKDDEPLVLPFPTAGAPGPSPNPTPGPPGPTPPSPPGPPPAPPAPPTGAPPSAATPD